MTDLRDLIIQAGRNGGDVDPFTREELRRAYGQARTGHDLDGIAAMVKVRDQLGFGTPGHEPANRE